MSDTNEQVTRCADPRCDHVLTERFENPFCGAGASECECQKYGTAARHMQDRPTVATKQTCDEQAEKLRREVVRAVRLGFVIGKMGAPSFDAKGQVVINGTEYAIHVMRPGELEGLQAERTLTSRMSEEIAAHEETIGRQAALIEEIRGLAAEVRCADIRAALARYDEKGGKS